MSSFDQDVAPGMTPPPPLDDLGLTSEQSEILETLASNRKGLVIFTGPPLSGKSRTVNSLLGSLEPDGRSLMSIEDPVEYKLPFGHQTEVNEALGNTFELLLSQVVEAEPGILFLSEIKDMVGAWACVEFAKKGHLAMATLPSCNATTAIFRLERLGVPRDQLGETLIGVVAQRLLHRLCPDCREVKPISSKEAELLAPFTSSPPTEVAHAVGCPACGGSGIQGKKAIFEVIKIGPVLAELIGEGLSISDIRQRARNQGVDLLTDGGLRGIRDLDFPVRDVYEDLLLEDLDRTMAARVMTGPGLALATPAPAPAEAEPGAVEGVEEAGPSVLVVEDDLDTRVLVERLLSGAGYAVSTAEDGAAALFKLATEQPDIVLSDIHMPNLDGMKLLELVHQHGIEAPVVLLTAEQSEDVEQRSYELGAKDFLRKPVDKAILLESLGRVLADEGA